MRVPIEGHAGNRVGRRHVAILIAVWAFLLLQLAVDTALTLTHREPFPTITMPAFSAEHIDTNGRATSTKRTIEIVGRDGTLHPLKAEDLLAPLYSVPAGGTIDGLLKQPGGANHIDEAAIEYLRRQAQMAMPAAEPVGIRVTWQPVILDVRSLEEIPAGDSTTREVRW